LAGAAQLAVSVVNWLATINVQPVLFPRLNFSKGIPSECRTLVVVPTMLSDEDYIEELLENLEVRYLANNEAQFTFWFAYRLFWMPTMKTCRKTML
jgi:cyclic beta-1,2-glucan synthetase